MSTGRNFVWQFIVTLQNRLFTLWGSDTEIRLGDVQLSSYIQANYEISQFQQMGLAEQSVLLTNLHKHFHKVDRGQKPPRKMLQQNFCYKVIGHVHMNHNGNGGLQDNTAATQKLPDSELESTLIRKNKN